MLKIDNKNYTIHKLAQNILSKSLLKLPLYILNKKAQKYFRFGYVIRLSNLVESRNKLFQLLQKDAGAYVDTTLHTLYINSIYINMFGALDNLAWALQHEFNLIEGVTENRNRKKIGLFAQEWTKALKQKDEKIVQDIDKFREWYEKCTDFRDSSAHRMPLYCPPAIQFGEDSTENLMLQKKLDAMDVDDESYMETFLAVNMKGIYKSWFCVNFEEDTIFYSLDRVVFDDYKSFLELSDLIMEWIAKINKIGYLY